MFQGSANSVVLMLRNTLIFSVTNSSGSEY
jgi:hypothetical protein